MDIDDVVFIIDYLYGDYLNSDPPTTGDVDCSDEIELEDVIFLLNYIFATGFAPCDPDGDGMPEC